MNTTTSVAELLALGDEELFARAQADRADLPQFTWSPNLINPACRTDPRCEHCKWECFKTEQQMFEARRPIDQILAQAEVQVSMGVKRILMPSGWLGYHLPSYFFASVRAVKERFDVEVFGLSGAIDRESLAGLKDAGMDGYWCGLESINEEIYRRFRPGGDTLADRLETIANVQDLGLKLQSGFVLGFGLPEADVIASLELLAGMELNSLVIQPFIPFPHTGMAAEDPVNPHYWARVVAAAGIYLPKVNVIITEADGPHANFATLTGANVWPTFPKLFAGGNQQPESTGLTLPKAG